jgi:hypothetical protein
LDLPHEEWKDDSSFVQLGHIVSAFRVVNDAAERTVKLGTEYTGVITKDEDQRQDIIQGVELTRRAFPSATRKCVLGEGKNLSSSVDDLMGKTKGYDAR